MSLCKILEEYSIQRRFHKDEQVINLNSLVKKLLLGLDVKYLAEKLINENKITKKVNGKLYFISENELFDVLEHIDKTPKVQEFYEKILETKNNNEEINEDEINIITINNIKYYRAHNIANKLGYKCSRNAILGNVNNEYKITYDELSKKKNINIKFHKNTVFITDLGVKQLVCKSKMPNSIEFAQKLGINCFDNKQLSHEQVYICKLLEIFKHEKLERQYYILNYKIDLYFIEHKLAIECDENNHNNRDQIYEISRQKSIENKLKCTFIRFNPDEKNFNFYNVVNKIIKFIYLKNNINK